MGAWLAWPLAFVFLTGALAVYGPEMDEAMYAAAACDGAHRGEIHVAWSVLAESAERATNGRVVTISAPERDGASAWALVEVHPREYETVFLDPNDGRARGIAPFLTPHRFLRDLHRDWMLGENVGLFVVTSLALALWISVATGLRFWSRRGDGGALRRYHRWASVVLLPFLAIVLITTTWYWGENIAGYFDIRPSGDIPRISPADVARVRRHDPTMSIDRLVSNARSVYPELEVHLVSLPTARRPIFSVAGHAGETGLVRELANQVFVHPYNGDVIEVRRARELQGVAWWEHVVDAIHFGTFGGAWTRALWMCSGVASAMLTVAGWLVRRRRLREAPATAARRP